MGISITSKTRVSAPDTAPVYGHIVSEDRLAFALRATNPLNFFDLSGNSSSLATSDILPNITQMGISDSTQSGYVKSTFKSELEDEFTVFLTGKLDMPPGGGDDWQSWIAGNYGTTDTAGTRGLGIHLRSGDLDGVRRHFIRCAYTRNTTSGGGPLFQELVFEEFDGQVAAPASPWFFVVMRLRKNPGDTFTAISDLMSRDLRAQSLPSGASVDFTKEGRLASMQLDTVETERADWWVLMSNSQSIQATPELKVKEALFYNRAMSDLEVAQQYEATKRWLRAEGVIDISTWV